MCIIFKNKYNEVENTEAAITDVLSLYVGKIMETNDTMDYMIKYFIARPITICLNVMFHSINGYPESVYLILVLTLLISASSFTYKLFHLPQTSFIEVGFTHSHKEFSFRQMLNS